MTLQGWVTVLNPVHFGDYPPQFAMTLEPYSHLLEPTFPSAGYRGSVSYRAWKARLQNETRAQ